MFLTRIFVRCLTYIMVGRYGTRCYPQWARAVFIRKTKFEFLTVAMKTRSMILGQRSQSTLINIIDVVLLSVEE